LDEGVQQVLLEFVQSDYGKHICEYCNVNPTARSHISAIFTDVRLEGTALSLTLVSSVEQRETQLLDKLSKFLRSQKGRIGVSQLKYEKRQPPTTQTFYI